MGVRESALSVINTIATSDFVRAVTSAGSSSKVTVQNLAKAIVETYTGSSLGGSSRSIKSAIDDLSTTIDSGFVQGVDIPAGETHDYDVTYNINFTSAPRPLACFVSTSSAAGFGRCTLSVLNRTATGFTIRVFNGDTGQRTPSLIWIAVKA